MSGRRKRTRRLPAPQTTAGTASAVAAPLEPRHLRLHLALVLLVSFALPLVLYALTLAPTVTFEDSGELIAAAYSLGIPHEPGYPLWTMIAHLFTLLPLGTIAYRVNLLSAVLAALTAALVAWLALLIIDEVAARARGEADPDERRWSPWLCGLSGSEGALACGGALAAGLLFACARTIWGYAIVAQEHDLNDALIALLLLLVVVWARAGSARSRTRVFYAICFALGVGLTVHDMLLLVLVVVAVFGLLIESRLRPRWRGLLVGAGFYAVGLLPLLYLPIAASRHPVLNWGDPENWTNFWRTVTRGQYVQTGHSGMAETLYELWYSLVLTRQQWVPVFLGVALAGLVLLFLRRRAFFWLALVFLFFMGPVTTYMTDFAVTSPDAAANLESRIMIAKFYMPAFLMISCLGGLGLYWGGLGLCRWLRPKVGQGVAMPAAVAVALAALPLIVGPLFFSHPDMHNYRVAQSYTHNVWASAAPNSLVMTDMDQFTFPLFYAQMVNHQRPDVVVLDQELLRRSWYLHQLAVDDPQLIAASRPQVDAFLQAVAPFEAGAPYDSATIDAAYYAMIDSFVRQYLKAGRHVYFTYTPPAQVRSHLYGESVIGAWSAHERAGTITPVSLSKFDFSELSGDKVALDSNALLMRSYYTGLLAARASMLAAAGSKAQAAALESEAQVLQEARSQ